jgi:hypothetical protein
MRRILVRPGRFLTNAVLVFLSLLCGCSAIGPKSVERDRFDYNTAISNSWKEQTLLNIVKLRYADMPLFVNVASIVAGYTLESEVRAGGVFPDKSNLGGTTFTAGASGRFIDRPTITYVPITGQQFNLSFMTPIPPSAVLFLMMNGWPADLIFPLIVDSMNGLRAGVAAGASQRGGDESFYRAITLLRQIQASGAVGMQINEGSGGKTTLLVFHPDGLSPVIRAAGIEVRKLLKIKQGSEALSVSYGSVPRTETEIAMLTRSMLQIMIDLATQVEVPPDHVRDGRALASIPPTEGAAKMQSIRIHSAREKPDSAFVGVYYRDHWFYIDDTDYTSKRTFAFIMILFSLTETGGTQGLPLVTIPAG